MVSPEEVVKHAQIQVQHLEAQAQAQAIAAVQVSAAAQRAEAEAQKHLVVHAQVAAQAQQLQAKAVHLQVRGCAKQRCALTGCWSRLVRLSTCYVRQTLPTAGNAYVMLKYLVTGPVQCCFMQVHADQLTSTAVAAEVAVAAAAASAGVDIARVASSTSNPLPVSSVGLGSAAAAALPAAPGVSPNLMPAAAMNPMVGAGVQQVGSIPVCVISMNTASTLNC